MRSPAVVQLVATDVTGASRDSRPLLLCSAVALLGGLVYLNALHNPFVYDDHRTIVDNGSIRSLTDPRSIVLHDVTRPLVNLSYALDRAVWGPVPFGFHLTSVLLHVLNVILLFQLARRLAEDRQLGSEQRAAGATPAPSPDHHITPLPHHAVAFVATGLFAVHPMMTEAVGYVSGRSEVLCGTFFLLAFLSARRWMRESARSVSEKCEHAPRRAPSWWFLTIGLWVAALLTKELAAMLTFVLVAYDRLMLIDGPPEGGHHVLADDADGSASAWRGRLWKLHVPLVGLAVAAGIGRLAVFAYLEHAGNLTLQWRSVLDEAGVIWRYVGLLLVPTGQSIFHNVRPVASILDPRALVAAGAIVLSVAFAWRSRRVDSLASFGVIWFFLLLVPSSLIVVLDQGEGMAEHRVYLASCGLFLAAGSLVGSLLERVTRVSPLTRALAGTVLAVGLLSLGARTVFRNAVWAYPVALWREATDKAPNNWLPRTVLGETLHDAGRHGEAVVAYKAALQLRPSEPLGYLKLGLCLAELGRFDEATATFEQLRSIDPRSTIVSTGLGAVAMVAGQPDRARDYFVETLKDDPRDVMARQWLAVLEEEAGANPAEALRRCEEIQQLAPGKLSNEDCIRRNRARLTAAIPGAR